MIAQLLEAKVIAALDAAFKDAGVDVSIQLFGAWQKSLADAVKNVENPGFAASCYVVLGNQQRTTYTTPTGSYAGSVTLSVRLERDTDGDLLLRAGEAIENLFTAWQSDTYQAAFEALDINDFSVDDVAVRGGNIPVVDFGRKIVSVNWPFTLSGTETKNNQ